jgi:hypothetical protein
MDAHRPVELCVNGEACEGRLVILSSSRAIAVGRRRLCLVGGVMTRMFIANGYKMRLLRGSSSSYFFFLSSHSIKRLQQLPLNSTFHHDNKAYHKPSNLHQHVDQLLPVPANHNSPSASPRQATPTAATIHPSPHQEPVWVQPIFRLATRETRECHHFWRRPLLFCIK